tara:strand:+ start:11 stop:601 length:591 start_codon:yes stop_codon:yes gene_type:complete
MPLLITELIFGKVNTISIPTDAIFIISLLIFFGLIGYLFNNLLSNHTNQFTRKINLDSNLELVKKKLEDQLTVDTTTLDPKTLEMPNIKKLNFVPASKLLGIGSLAFFAMGGASLLGIQHMQKSYESLQTSRTNIKIENQSTTSTLSMVDIKPLDKSQTNVKKIGYIDPFLSNIKSSKGKNYYQVREKQIENHFSF